MVRDPRVHDRHVGVDPLVEAVDLGHGEIRAPIRETPVGIVCAVRWMSSSGTTEVTFGSARSALRCCFDSVALKPRNARVNVPLAWMRSLTRWWLTTVFGSVPERRTTMYLPVGSTPPVSSLSGVGGSATVMGSVLAVGSGEGEGDASAEGDGSTLGSAVGSLVGSGVGSTVGVGSGLDSVAGGTAGSAADAGIAGATAMAASSRQAIRRRMNTPGPGLATGRGSTR